MIIIVAICAIVGRVTANSYVDNVDLQEYLAKENITIAFCDMGYDPDTNKGYLDNDKIYEVDDLITEDAIIVTAKLNNAFKRKLYYECIFSEVEILEVYAGDLKAGETISVFEPVDCGFENQILCTDGYSMMQEGEEYVLFLKKLKNTYYGEDDYVYAPSSTVYSKYSINDTMPKLFTYDELEEEENLYLYDKIKNQDVYLYDKGNYEKYVELKKEVLERYH